MRITGLHAIALAVSLVAALALACGDDDASPVPARTGDGTERTDRATAVGAGPGRGSFLRTLMRSGAQDDQPQDVGPGDESLAAFLLRSEDLPPAFSDGGSEIRELRGGGDLPAGRIDLGVSVAFTEEEPDDDEGFTFSLISGVLRFDEEVDAEAFFLGDLPDDDLSALRNEIESDLDSGDELADLELLDAVDLGRASFGLRVTVASFEYDDESGDYRTDAEPLLHMTSEVYAFALDRYVAFVLRNSFGERPPDDLDPLELIRLLRHRIQTAS